MKTLLIDAGNSHLKWAVLSEAYPKADTNDDLISNQQSFSHSRESSIDAFKNIIASNTDCSLVVMVSVLGEKFSQAAKEIAIEHHKEFLEVLSSRENSNIKNGYQDPARLGADRFVGMIAAFNLLNAGADTNQACIVIDSGTATTIDAVDNAGNHLGGVILPGLNLCSNSLLSNTKQLGLWGNEGNGFTPDCFSTETTQAIASGCLLGHAGAIEHLCNMMEQQLQQQSDLKNIKVKRYICGGSAESLIPHMLNNYDYRPDLLMFGLKVIKEDLKNNV